MVKRKFMGDAEYAKRQEYERGYQLIQNVRKNERRALLIKNLTTSKPKRTFFEIVKGTYRSIAGKKERTVNQHVKVKDWNRRIQ